MNIAHWKNYIEDKLKNISSSLKKNAQQPNVARQTPETNLPTLPKIAPENDTHPHTDNIDDGGIS